MSEEDDEPFGPPWVKCPECAGSGEQGCSGGYLEECGRCNGIGTVEPCAVCGLASKTLYDDREDMPSCGRAKCELQMQRYMDYDDEVGNR